VSVKILSFGIQTLARVLASQFVAKIQIQLSALSIAHADQIITLAQITGELSHTHLLMETVVA
jgi:hypothetical protein